MSISIQPPSTRSSPVSKSVIGASAGKKVVDLSPRSEMEVRQRERSGVVAEETIDTDLTFTTIKSVISSKGQPLYSGSSDLEDHLDRMMMYVTGEKHFDSSVGFGARYGFLGMLARRLPAPILFDNEDVASVLFPPDNKTFCVDPSGRMWIYADFFKKCIKSDQTDGLMTLPVINHEHFHIALNHCMRMHNFDPVISNVAKDTVINPMVKGLYAQGTRFAKDFEKALGNRTEDARFAGLSEETVAKILQSEAVEAFEKKGTIRIKLLEIVDGKIGPQPKVLKAGQGEVVDLDHVIVTVEEIFDKAGNSIDDKIDTEFDCAIVEIDKTINNLKTRHRKGSANGSSSKSNVIDIPVKGDPSNGSDNNGEDDKKDNGKPSERRRVNPNNPVDFDSSNVFNGNAAHEVDMKKVKDALKKGGFGEFSDKIVKPDSFNPESMDILLETAMSEAQLEKAKLGSYYPGGHIDEYIRDVVRPASKHKVSWRQRTMELLQGTGKLITRSIDEQSVLSLLDPDDLGMDDDEMPVLPGIIPAKPDSRIAVIIDSSGSMDEGRLVEAMSFIFGICKSNNDMAPDVDLFSADTALRGEPIILNEETLNEFVAKGVPIFGRGGTEITGPLNELVKYSEKKEKKYQSVLYVTDFGFMAPDVENIPPELPPLVFLGIPADYKASADVISRLSKYAEVICIDKNMDLDLINAESKASVRGKGIKF